mmetsp:Transcript_85093/g.264375  ORF Transcript_85093/g.264375 Transcript_85093/m.264375 type:complete len:322 (+) Transcript_85093:34-999(+)
MQEVDPPLRAALGPDLAEGLIQGRPDRDGRGVKVDSATALLLRPGGGLRSVEREHALLKVPTRRGSPPAGRDHVAVLVGRERDGQAAVFCSVHLHPPGQIERGGMSYWDYLEPLRRAIERVAAVPETGSGLAAPCFLVGDFNVAPEEFISLTRSHPFWGCFAACAPEGGDTAHETNPSVRGDFAIISGGRWHGQALGPPDFRSFERYADLVTATADSQIRLPKLVPALEQAVAACQRAALGLRHAGPHAEPDGPHRSDPVKPLLDKALSSLRRAQQQLGVRRERSLTRRHRKGLLTSDHRPLHFEGYTSSIASDRSGETST